MTAQCYRDLHARRTAVPSRGEGPPALRPHFDHCPPSSPARPSPLTKDWPYAWTFGWDLLSQEEIGLPVSMIHMGNRTTTRIFDLFSFQTTTNGLASGNNLLEAIHAGLLEVIERDAVTCY